MPMLDDRTGFRTWCHILACSSLQSSSTASSPANRAKNGISGKVTGQGQPWGDFTDKPYSGSDAMRPNAALLHRIGHALGMITDHSNHSAERRTHSARTL
jgi:hypothetical protein